VKAFAVHSLSNLLLRTLLLNIGPLFRARHAVWVKLAYENPTGSIKDVPVLNILQHLDRTDQLASHNGLVEVSSGNTGISLAYWASLFGTRATIVMPRGMSRERFQMMRALGARVLTHGRTFNSARSHALKLARQENLLYFGQFARQQNPQAYQKLAEEIATKKVAYVVAGVGTGGTLMGLAHHLRPLGAQTVAVFPAETRHGIQGIGDGIMGDFWNPSHVDHSFRVSTPEARAHTRLLWRHGFLAGVSSGANLAAALHFARLGPVATVLPDSWDRYISVMVGTSSVPHPRVPPAKVLNHLDTYISGE